MHFFIPPIMPKENGPFFAALFTAGGVNGEDLSCADCYKCVQYAGSSCVRCVYDSNYCEVLEFPDEECQGGAQWDSIQRKCVCPDTIAAVCFNPWEFFDSSDSVCGCAGVACISGKYPVAANTCADCPSPDFTLSSCSVQSSVGYATDTEMLIGGYNGCYIPGGCAGKDDTGTFELIADCKYSTALEAVEDVDY